VILGGVAMLIVWTSQREGRTHPRPSPSSTTSRQASHASLPSTAEGLAATVEEAERRLTSDPGDARAAIQLADASMRLARVNADGGLVARADAVLKTALDRNPADYELQQTQALVHLSAHRFRQAIEVAERGRSLRPLDPTNYGILGDAHLELGEYADAFDAFDRMMRLRPSAASYARVAYARELQGDLSGALESMTLALAAVPGNDRESVAWHYSQIGELQLALRDVDAAASSFIAASQAFPGHPFAVIGYARVLVARGDRSGAIEALQTLTERGTLPDAHVLLGDLLLESGRRPEAEKHYALAEAAWRSDAQEPRHLAKFLAARGRAVEAVQIAEAAATARRDIFTEDALAWAYYKAGRTSDAKDAIARALRTGTRDPEILAHAGQIRRVSQVAMR
jgi:tetratricopeptide (TPR) repeat protein